MLYDIEVKKSNGEEIKLSEYKDKVILIVNVASKCGFTKQYLGLQKLYETYGKDGFIILGFPCNQFGEQEPDPADKVASECKLNFGVTFPIMEKIEVNGENEHKLYTYLKEEKSGLLGSSIKWNFTKFLIDKNGNVVKRFAPNTEPEKICDDIEKLL
ncbi:glutathione peroxidase [Oceanivirga salmonicida]|uniref:glutathione peroxidase n=1 Tax=Oceanivirga salmonicida TaxID=1769291 RepID=UPI0038B28140